MLLYGDGSSVVGDEGGIDRGNFGRGLGRGPEQVVAADAEEEE